MLLAVAAEGFPSVFWLPTLCVLVTIYVDDILAAGRAEGLKSFWSQLREHIDLDEVTSVERFLGRYHLFSEDGTTVYMQMSAYAQQAIDLYLSLPGAMPLKSATTPDVAEGSLPLEDFEVRGALADSSAKILMKLLWLSRLCRPDLAHIISMLAVQSSTWSRNADKQVHRLLCYLQHTAGYSLRGVVEGLTAQLLDSAGLIYIAMQTWVDVSTLQNQQAASGFK